MTYMQERATNRAIFMRAALGLPALAMRFEIARRLLDDLQRMWAEHGDQEECNDVIDRLFERQTETLLADITALSLQASRIKAQNISELAIKAGIWLDRHIPENDDEITRLAVSICEDIVTLSQYQQSTQSGTDVQHSA